MRFVSLPATTGHQVIVNPAQVRWATAVESQTRLEFDTGRTLGIDLPLDQVQTKLDAALNN